METQRNRLKIDRGTIKSQYMPDSKHGISATDYFIGNHFLYWGGGKMKKEARDE